MELAMHNWMRAEPIETTIRRLARFGYDSLEISSTQPREYDTTEVLRVLKENGIRCSGAVTLMIEEKSLVAGTEEARARSVEYVNDTITLTKELEGDVVSIVPNEVGKVTPESTPEEEWGWAVACLEEIYEFAQREGIRLAIEPINRFETYFISRAAQGLALADAVSSEIGLCLDTFHLNIEEPDPYAAIRDAGDRLVDLHVADNNRLAPGMGHYDWERVVEILREIGYDGPLSVEYVATIDRTPANPFPNAVETDPVNITPEQRKFIEDHGSDLLSEEFYSSLAERSAKTLRPLIG